MFLVVLLPKVLYYNNFDIFNYFLQSEDALKNFFENFTENLEKSLAFLAEFLVMIKGLF